MRNIIIYIFLIVIFLITECKRVESETIKSNDNDKINEMVLSQDTIKLIEKLSGGRAKKAIKMKDAEIMNINGKTSKLSDYKGKVIMLNLWATWCPPCRAEMPSMQKLYDKFKNKNFTIIAVSQGENLKTVKKFVGNNSYKFPIFIDKNNEIASSYNTGSIPTTYLINKQGYLIAQFIGGRDWHSNDSIELINELLK